MAIKLNNRNKKPFYLYIISGLVLLVIISGIIFVSTDNWLKNKLLNINPTADNGSQEVTNKVDYSGPTKTDIEQSQDGKKNPENEEKPVQDESSEKTNALIAISFADVINGNVEVRAFITNLIEGNGVCTATLSQGSLIVTKSSPAFIDVSSSQCEPIYLPLSEFPAKGEWKLIVTYKSTQHSGKSEEIKVNI